MSPGPDLALLRQRSLGATILAVIQYVHFTLNQVLYFNDFLETPQSEMHHKYKSLQRRDSLISWSVVAGEGNATGSTDL